MWQALRRIWRLGQMQDVKAVFSVYEDTMEQTALALMGQKMKAAQQLYGVNVGGALVQDDEDDILSMLSRQINRSTKITDLQGIFVGQAHVLKPSTEIVVPQPTVLTPQPVFQEQIESMDWGKWMEKMAKTLDQDEPKKRRPKNNSGLMQQSMF